MQKRIPRYFQLFLSVQVALLIAFFVLDCTAAQHGLSSALKYMSVVFCLAYALLHVRQLFSRSTYRLLCVALALTAAADFFLLFTPYYGVGVCIFIIVQILHAVRYNQAAHRRMLGMLFCAGCALAVLYKMLNTFGFQIPPLYVLSAMYAICLGCALVQSLTASRRAAGTTLSIRTSAAGIVLFFLCDINVALFNLTAGMPQTVYLSIYNVSNLLIWLFYAPAQVLLTVGELISHTQK